MHNEARPITSMKPSEQLDFNTSPCVCSGKSIILLPLTFSIVHLFIFSSSEVSKAPGFEVSFLVFLLYVRPFDLST